MWRAPFLLAFLPLAVESVPVHGIHLTAPSPDDTSLALRFIEEALPKEGVNLLVLVMNHRYQSSKRPEVVDT